MGCHGDGALVKLHSEADPVTSLYLQGLLQHNSRLLPVRVLAEGADADVLVQIDVVPEGNCSYSASRCRPDLGDRDIVLMVHENSQLETILYIVPVYLFSHVLLPIIHDPCKNFRIRMQILTNTLFPVLAFNVYELCRYCTSR